MFFAYLEFHDKMLLVIKIIKICFKFMTKEIYKKPNMRNIIKFDDELTNGHNFLK